MKGKRRKTVYERASDDPHFDRPACLRCGYDLPDRDERDGDDFDTGRFCCQRCEEAWEIAGEEEDDDPTD